MAKATKANFELKFDNAKSASLTDIERMRLPFFIKEFGSQRQAAEHIGISRMAMIGVMHRGSGSPDSIQKVRTALEKYQ